MAKRSMKMVKIMAKRRVKMDSREDAEGRPGCQTKTSCGASLGTANPPETS